VLLFLDLEETLIDSWSNTLMLPSKLKLIQRMFAHLVPTVGLMSWAVYHDADKVVFNDTLRADLEEALGMTFSDDLVWSMDDWAKQLFAYSGKKVSRDDLFDCFSKHEVLFMLSRVHPAFRNQEVFLVDDAVEHELSWHSKVNNSTVKVLNVDELLKSHT
jgi:hypothetical protein